MKGTKEKRIRLATRVYKVPRIAELEEENRELRSKVFDLERAAFQAEQLLNICDSKLTHWVHKHDELLIKHKEYLKNNEPKA